jgi:hypothetical protein
MCCMRMSSRSNLTCAQTHTRTTDISTHYTHRDTPHTCIHVNTHTLNCTQTTHTHTHTPSHSILAYPFTCPPLTPRLESHKWVSMPTPLMPKSRQHLARSTSSTNGTPSGKPGGDPSAAQTEKDGGAAASPSQQQQQEGGAEVVEEVRGAGCVDVEWRGVCRNVCCMRVCKSVPGGQSNHTL